MPEFSITGAGNESTMRRKRFQRGSLAKRKHGGVWVWVAQWWENGARRSKVLGRAAQMSRSQADAILAAILRPINEGTAQTARPVLTFREFVERVYFPHCRRTWKQSTQITTPSTIRKHLIEEFGDRALGTIGRSEMQDLLEMKALELSRSPVSHLRWHLNGILKLAMADG